jgi:hypothetical protein
MRYTPTFFYRYIIWSYYNLYVQTLPFDQVTDSLTFVLVLPVDTLVKSGGIALKIHKIAKSREIAAILIIILSFDFPCDTIHYIIDLRKQYDLSVT